MLCSHLASDSTFTRCQLPSTARSFVTSGYSAAVTSWQTTTRTLQLHAPQMTLR